MADLKRSRDSSSHGPSKLPRLSSFHPDEDLDNPVHTFVGRYMGMMRDRKERYNTLLAFASEDNTEFRKFHAKIVNNERRLEQALAHVFEMTFSVHEELDAIENYELPRAVSSGPQWYRRENILGMFHSKVHCQTLTPDIRPQLYNSSTTACPRAPIRCIHRQNFGLLSHLLRQAHAETRRSCVLAVSHRLPTELVDIIYEFTLRAEGVPIDSTTWSEVEVIHPESKDENEYPESEDEDDYHYKPSGDVIRKRIHSAYQCPAITKTVLRHNLWKYASTEVLQTEMF